MVVGIVVLFITGKTIASIWGIADSQKQIIKRIKEKKNDKKKSLLSRLFYFNYKFKLHSGFFMLKTKQG